MKEHLSTLKTLAITVLILWVLSAILNWQNDSHAHHVLTHSSAVTQPTGGPDCKVTVEAEDGDLTSADRERTQQIADRLCAAELVAESGTTPPPPPAPTAQDVTDTRSACEDLHRQGFMTDVDCVTVSPQPRYYHHR